jgi:hypothetical protein
MQRVSAGKGSGLTSNCKEKPACRANSLTSHCETTRHRCLPKRSTHDEPAGLALVSEPVAAGQLPCCWANSKRPELRHGQGTARRELPGDLAQNSAGTTQDETGSFVGMNGRTLWRPRRPAPPIPDISRIAGSRFFARLGLKAHPRLSLRCPDHQTLVRARINVPAELPHPFFAAQW